MLHESDRPILVTGASSGVGRAISDFLATKGHSVYAGVRKQKDYEELTKVSGIAPLQLDVTKSNEVQDALKKVLDAGLGLYGLVNCAGVVGLGPLMDTPVEEFNRVLGVNLIGVHRMIHKFGPLVTESHGRIVNISSVGGFLTETWFGPYGTSKHALEGYDEVLRKEMAAHGVKVITITPGSYRSRIGINFFEFIGHDVYTPWEKSVFKEEMKQVADWWLNTPGALDRTKWPEPVSVALAAYDALFSEHPKSRYLVSDRETAEEVLDKMMKRVIELNDGHSNPLTSSELKAKFEKLLLP
ncbi:MAG: SDR family NAD(P)-dependent oxidoreductase [Nitrososphaerota archaeon]|nr:SDR family NAD(P)-dependent oxidoreductase [Nitrososphaerota archaeon]